MRNRPTPRLLVPLSFHCHKLRGVLDAERKSHQPRWALGSCMPTARRHSVQGRQQPGTRTGDRQEPFARVERQRRMIRPSQGFRRLRIPRGMREGRHGRLDAVRHHAVVRCEGDAAAKCTSRDSPLRPSAGALSKRHSLAHFTISIGRGSAPVVRAVFHVSGRQAECLEIASRTRDPDRTPSKRSRAVRTGCGGSVLTRIQFPTCHV